MQNTAQMDSLMLVVRPKGWLALYVLLSFVVIAFAWAVVDTVPMTVTGDGILLSPGGVLDVVSSTQGLLTDYKVHPGDTISAGQVVALVDQPLIDQRLAEAQRERSMLLDLKSKMQSFQARQGSDREKLFAGRRTDLEQTLASLREQLTWAQDRGKGLQVLYDKNIITRSKYMEYVAERGRLDQAIAKAEADLRQLSSEENSSRIQTEKENLEIDNKIANAAIKISGIEQERERETKIISPYGGTVVELFATAGEVVSRGTQLFTVVPSETAGNSDQDGLVAVIYVSAADGKKVKRGMQAQVVPVIVKRTEYGGMFGQVRSVSDIPSTNEGMLHTLKNRALSANLAGGAAPYEVRLTMRRDPTNRTGYHWTSRPPNLTISPGTLCSVDIVVLRIHPITLLVPALKQFLPDESL